MALDNKTINTNDNSYINETMKTYTDEKNGYNYTKDNAGRVIGYSGHLQLEALYERNNEIQKSAGGDNRFLTNKDGNKIPADGGHLFAHIFGGATDDKNIVAMDRFVNRSSYKSFENMVKDNLQKGNKVYVEGSINYIGESNRPSNFMWNVTIKDENGNEIDRQEWSLTNDDPRQEEYSEFIGNEEERDNTDYMTPEQREIVNQVNEEIEQGIYKKSDFGDTIYQHFELENEGNEQVSNKNENIIDNEKTPLKADYLNDKYYKEMKQECLDKKELLIQAGEVHALPKYGYGGEEQYFIQFAKELKNEGILKEIKIPEIERIDSDPQEAYYKNKDYNENDLPEKIKEQLKPTIDEANEEAEILASNYDKLTPEERVKVNTDTGDEYNNKYSDINLDNDELRHSILQDRGQDRTYQSPYVNQIVENNDLVEPDTWKQKNLKEGDIVYQLSNGDSPSNYFIPSDVIDKYRRKDGSIDTAALKNAYQIPDEFGDKIVLRAYVLDFSPITVENQEPEKNQENENRTIENSVTKSNEPTNNVDELKSQKLNIHDELTEKIDSQNVTDIELNDDIKSVVDVNEIETIDKELDSKVTDANKEAEEELETISKTESTEEADANKEAEEEPEAISKTESTEKIDANKKAKEELEATSETESVEETDTNKEARKETGTEATSETESAEEIDANKEAREETGTEVTSEIESIDEAEINKKIGEDTGTEITPETEKVQDEDLIGSEAYNDIKKEKISELEKTDESNNSKIDLWELAESENVDDGKTDETNNEIDLWELTESENVDDGKTGQTNNEIDLWGLAESENVDDGKTGETNNEIDLWELAESENVDDNQKSEQMDSFKRPEGGFSIHDGHGEDGERTRYSDWISSQGARYSEELYNPSEEIETSDDDGRIR